jgi:hypothetical protein
LAVNLKAAASRKRNESGFEPFLGKKTPAQAVNQNAGEDQKCLVE